jgi:hypothetical protein
MKEKSSYELPFDETKVLDLFDKVEELLEKRPDKRKKSEWNLWKEEINGWIDKTNKLGKCKLYDKVK